MLNVKNMTSILWRQWYIYQWEKLSNIHINCHRWIYDEANQINNFFFLEMWIMKCGNSMLSEMEKINRKYSDLESHSHCYRLKHTFEFQKGNKIQLWNAQSHRFYLIVLTFTTPTKWKQNGKQCETIERSRRAVLINRPLVIYCR